MCLIQYILEEALIQAKAILRDWKNCPVGNQGINCWGIDSHGPEEAKNCPYPHSGRETGRQSIKNRILFLFSHILKLILIFVTSFLRNLYKPCWIFLRWWGLSFVMGGIIYLAGNLELLWMTLCLPGLLLFLLINRNRKKAKHIVPCRFRFLLMVYEVSVYEQDLINFASFRVRSGERL